MRGASPIGTQPKRIRLAYTRRGPNWSHSGPVMNRRKKVAERETMFELAIWAGVRFKSCLIVTVSNGGNVYLEMMLIT